MKIANILVKKGSLRAQPTFVGQIITNVCYGERVDITDELNGWSKIRVIRTGQTGWIHNSALSSKAITLKSGTLNAGHSATSDELALAGKGFNKQVEQQFRAKNPKIDFSWVNKMESFTISERQIQSFLQEGQVRPTGGQS